MSSNKPPPHEETDNNARHSISLIPTKDNSVVIILTPSEPSITALDILVPFGSAIIGGLFVLWGTVIQGRAAERHARQARKRDLSIEAARTVDVRLVEFERLAFDQGYFDAHGFDDAAHEKIALVCVDPELHRRYINDSDLQQSIKEAVQFLRPYGGFEEFADETNTGIIRNVVRWLRPIIQAHIMDEERPQEPPYVQTYREAYQKGKKQWEEFWAAYDQKRSPENQ